MPNILDTLIEWATGEKAKEAAAAPPPLVAPPVQEVKVVVETPTPAPVAVVEPTPTPVPVASIAVVEPPAGAVTGFNLDDILKLSNAEVNKLWDEGKIQTMLEEAQGRTRR